MQISGVISLETMNFFWLKLDTIVLWEDGITNGDFIFLVAQGVDS